MSEETAPAEFDGGPLHEATRLVPLEEGSLPQVVVTDEGDYWVTYVLGRTRADDPIYRYAGGALAGEIADCLRVGAPTEVETP